MLSEDETREIRSIMDRYEYRQAACVEALKAVQRRRYWISDESLKDVADLLGMTADQLEGVATFYSLLFRRPVGRHVIYVCSSVVCWVLGYEPLLRQLEETLGIRLGETTADGRFTLLPISCLGACDRAPAIMVDDDLHAEVGTESIQTILSRYQ